MESIVEVYVLSISIILFSVDLYSGRESPSPFYDNVLQ